MPYTIKDITISPKLLEFLVKKKKEKAFFFYNYLRRTRECGAYKGIQADLDVISKELKISQNTIRKLIKELENLNFIRFQYPKAKGLKKKGTLFIRSMYKIGHDLKLYENSNKTKRFKFSTTYKDSRLDFFVKNEENARVKQIYKAKDALFTKSPSKNIVKVLDKLTERELMAYLKECDLERGQEIIHLGSSRSSIADRLGLNHSSSSDYWIRKAKANKRIKGELKSTKYWGMYSKLKMDTLIQEYGNRFFVVKGNIYERLCNRILFNNKELNSIAKASL